MSATGATQKIDEATVRSGNDASYSDVLSELGTLFRAKTPPSGMRIQLTAAQISTVIPHWPQLEFPLVVY